MVDVDGVQICYETIGEADGEPLLLIMGLGGPMLWWDDAFCAALADRGFYVIRYDNRDCGRSSKMRGRVKVVRTYLGVERPPYALTDMARDAVGLLEHLGLDSAHVAGMSMGGMIAQTLAIHHPERVRSLVSIMSTTGNKLVGYPSPKALQRLFDRRARTREQYINAAVSTWRMLSADFGINVDHVKTRAAATFDRGLNPAGYYRHVGAVNSAPDRTRLLREVTAPTLVIHGTKDPLVHVSGGKATARAVPGAELMLIPGMGHDLPRSQHDVVADAIARTARRGSRHREQHPGHRGTHDGSA